VTELEEIASNARAKMTIEQEARSRFAMAASASGVRRSRFERVHKFYAPVDGDQWPEDRALRPGKLHITANMVRAFVDTEARVLSLLPRISNKPPTADQVSAKKAETIEELFSRYLDMTGWDVWMADRERMGSLYGTKILKPFWNDDDKRPDVSLVEQPQNLMLGYGASDYSVVDWAIYRYSISALQAKRRYPDIQIKSEKGKPPVVSIAGGDHYDPLQQRSLASTARSSLAEVINKLTPKQTDGEYEQSQLEVWDYWYLNDEGTVCNAIILQGCLVAGPFEHDEMPIIPYIVTEHDHEPGSPEGQSTAELLIDLQMALNRVLSHESQVIADNSGTAYQLTGENADTVPENVVAKEDEISPTGTNNRIEPIQRNANNYNMEALIDRIWSTAHKITGLPEIMFGELPGAQTAGRATAVQIQAAQNRIDSKRRRSYEGLRQLLLFWGYMLEKRNPTVTTTARQEAQGDQPPTVVSQQIKIGEFIKGWQNWKIIPPEITPRDEIEHTNNIIQLVNAKLMPLSKGMDELGIDNPQQMLALVEEERSNARLFPADVQSNLAASLLLKQIEQANAMSGGDAAQQAGAADARLKQEAQQRAPTLTEDMNQPATAAGGFPPPGAPAPGIGGEFQPLVRQTPSGESQALSQFQLPGTEI
jgi:hypothetical protein